MWSGDKPRYSSRGYVYLAPGVVNVTLEAGFGGEHFYEWRSHSRQAFLLGDASMRAIVIVGCSISLRRLGGLDKVPRIEDTGKLDASSTVPPSTSALQ